MPTNEQLNIVCLASLSSINQRSLATVGLVVRVRVRVEVEAGSVFGLGFGLELHGGYR